MYKGKAFGMYLNLDVLAVLPGEIKVESRSSKQFCESRVNLGTCIPFVSRG